MADIISYLRIIKRWWWVIVLLCGVTVGSLVALTYLSETKYQATVMLQVSVPPPQEVPLFSQFGRSILSEEIEQNRSSFNAFLLEGNTIDLALETLPDVSVEADDLIAEGKVIIELPESSQFMRVRVVDQNPETAALLANAIAEVGLKEYGELLARPTISARQFMERQLEAAWVDLNEAESHLSQFQIDNKIGSLDDAIASQHDLIKNLKIEGDLAQSEGNPAKADLLDNLILEHEANLQNLIGFSAKYNELQAHVEKGRSNVRFLLDKSVEAQLKENQILDGGFIQIITPARPPRNPVSAISNSLIILAAVGSILAGILLAFLLEYSSLSQTQPYQQRRSDRPEPIVALPDRAN